MSQYNRKMLYYEPIDHTYSGNNAIALALILPTTMSSELSPPPCSSATMALIHLSIESWNNAVGSALQEAKSSREAVHGRMG